VDFREFRTCLARLALLSTDGILQVNHLPARSGLKGTDAAEGSAGMSIIRMTQRRMILAAIERESGISVVAPDH